MSTENIQRQHLEELRKQTAASRTPSPSNSDGPKRRTARKSISRRSSVDSDASTSRDSRTSEQDEIQKIILGLEKDTENSNSSKDSSLGRGVFGPTKETKAEILPPAKPFLFAIGEPIFKKNPAAAHSTALTKDSVNGEALVTALKGDETLFLAGKPAENVPDENPAVDDGEEKNPDSSVAEGESEIKIEDVKEVDDLLGDGQDESAIRGVQTDNADTKDKVPDEDGMQKPPEEGLEEIDKVWENIRKDLTCLGDVKEDETKDEDEDYDPVEELTLGQSIPQPEEEPSDWEDWEEASDNEQTEDVENVDAPKAAAEGECVLLSSDDESPSKRSKENADQETEKTDVVQENADVTVKDETMPEEDVENTSDVVDVAAKTEELKEPDDGEENEAQAKENETEEMETNEEFDEDVKEKKEPIDFEGDLGDDLAIIEEKRSEKRTADDVDNSSFAEEPSEVKKAKLDSSELKEEIVIKDDDEKEEIIEEKPEATILSKKILEELISRKIKDFMVEGNRNAFASLKDRCDELEKSVERWKYRAQQLQNQLNESVMEQRRYNARKPKVATRTVGINVRMVQIQSPVTQSGQSKTIQAAAPSASNVAEKPSTTRAGPVPCQLIANMTSPVQSTSVLASSTQAVKLTTTSSTATSASVRLIDLTQDEENAHKTIAAALPAGTIVRPTVTLSSTMMGTISSIPSVMQLIPSSPSTTVTRLPTSQTVAPGARVTYFVPNALGPPRQLVAIPQQNIIGSPRAPMQTILLRMNTVPTPAGTTNTAQFLTTAPPPNTTLSLVSSPPAIRPAISQAKVAIAAASSTTTTTAISTTSTTAPLNALIISSIHKHPGPLPLTPTYKDDPKLKSPPPMPVLKISRVTQGIVLSWNMTVNAIHAEISVYQLYAYQETAGPPSTTLWKKVGDVRALPLPMACTLTQFVQGHKYHFAVRAVDVNNRLGPFSEPTSIILHTK